MYLIPVVLLSVLILTTVPLLPTSQVLAMLIKSRYKDRKITSINGRRLKTPLNFDNESGPYVCKPGFNHYLGVAGR